AVMDHAQACVVENPPAKTVPRPGEFGPAVEIAAVWCLHHGGMLKGEHFLRQHLRKRTQMRLRPAAHVEDARVNTRCRASRVIGGISGGYTPARATALVRSAGIRIGQII